MKNAWKKTLAGLTALVLVAGAMPANVGGFLTGGSGIVANAEEHTSPYVVGTTLHLAGSGWTISTMWYQVGVSNNGSIINTPTSQDETITKIVADQGTVLPANCSSFAIAFKVLTEIDLTNADASEVTNMNSMFATGGLLQGSFSASKGEKDTQLTSIKFGSNFNTAKVTDMNYMFQNRAGLTSLDLSSFNTSEVKSMNAMFNKCTGLTTVTVGSGWNTDKVTKSSSMFGSCTSIKGKNGTTYDSQKTDKTYAHIDGFGGIGYFWGEAVTYTKVPAKAATCTESGNIEYYTGSDGKYYTKNGETYTETTLNAVTIAATGHSYGEPVWQWAEDHSTAKAKFTCANNGSHTEEVSATVSVETTDPTYAVDGQTKYTATVTFNGQTYTDVQTETLSLPTIETGQCGESVNYKLFEDGTLYVYGTGATYNYYRDSPFTNKESISKIIVAEGVTDIGDCLFYSTNASSVSLPVSLRTIGDKAFQLSEKFTTIAIPEGVTSIGEESFATMDLTSISLPNTLETIGNGAFYRSDSLEEIIIPDSVTTIGDTLFSGCSSLSSVTLSNQITGIPNFTFYGCEELTSVDIPSSVTSIGNRAFTESGITSITIPENVTSLGFDIFDRCSSLTHITFENQSVLKCNEDYDQFWGDISASLTSITFGEKVTQIGNEDYTVFEEYENVSKIYCFADPENLSWYGLYDFKPDKETICYVPSRYLEIYQDKFGDSVNVTFEAYDTWTFSETDSATVKFAGDNTEYTASAPEKTGTKPATYQECGKDIYTSSYTYNGRVFTGSHDVNNDEAELQPLMNVTADSSKMDINIYVPIEEGDNLADYTVTFGDDVQSMSTIDVDGQDCGTFSLTCSAKEMADMKALVIKNGEGEILSQKQVSVASYLKQFENDATFGNMAKSMLRYGAAAQTYFNVGGTLANDGVTGYGLDSLADVEITDNSPTTEEYNTAFDLEYSKYYAMNMTFTSDTTLLIAFRITGSAEAAKSELLDKLHSGSYEISCNEDDTGDFMIVKVKNIPIKKLGDAIFTFGTGDNAVEIKATDYLARIANNDEKPENLRNLCKSLYAFYKSTT